MTQNLTPEQSLLRADQALLENLARAVRSRAAAAEDVAKGGLHLAQSAQRVAEYGFKADALLEVVRSSGAGARHQAAFEAAWAGDEDKVFDLFWDLRDARA